MSNFRDVKNVEKLIAFLETQGSNHKYYYHYTSWDSFVKIYTGCSFLLTRGNSLTINDQHEALMKGSWNVWNRTYIGSFAFGSSENMAMWGLYGLPWEDAIRIAIPKNEMLSWVNNISCVSLWDKEIKENINLPKISLTDVVYVEGYRGENNLKLIHHGKSFTTRKTPSLFGVDTSPQMTGYIKNYAWSYENEVRIRIELPQDTGYEKILLNIPKETIDSIQVTTGPYFRWKNDALYKQLCNQNRISESGFKDLVGYRTICSMCQHEIFERRWNNYGNQSP